MKKVDVSKCIPEKINPNAMFFNLGMLIGMTKQYLDDHPDTKQKVMKLLDEENESQ